MKHRTDSSGPEGSPAGQRKSWGARLLALFCSAILGLLHRSWRAEVVGLENLENLLSRDERVLVVFWHGKYIPFFTILRDRGACIFASRSFRGEVICDICRHFGHHCLTIPEGGGGEVSLRMREALAGRQLAALVPDGPRGPYHRVKPGAIRFAADLGMTLLPVSSAARPRFALVRRWDRMEIPLPLSRVRLVFGMPIAVPRDLGGRAVGWWQQHLAEALEKAGEQAEAGWNGENEARREE